MTRALQKVGVPDNVEQRVLEELEAFHRRQVRRVAALQFKVGGRERELLVLDWCACCRKAILILFMF